MKKYLPFLSLYLYTIRSKYYHSFSFIKNIISLPIKSSFSHSSIYTFQSYEMSVNNILPKIHHYHHFLLHNQNNHLKSSQEPGNYLSNTPLNFDNHLDYNMIMLNCSLSTSYKSIWNKAKYKICTDGASNHLYDYSISNENPYSQPHCIIGDLDSIRSDVLQYYVNQSIPVIKDLDQNKNDLEKALLHLLSIDQPAGLTLICGAFKGRIDHQFSCFHILYKYKNSFKKIILFDNSNLSFILRPGQEHHLYLTQYEGPHIALLPLGSKVEKVTTSGLKWELVEAPLSFDKMISTSNTYLSSHIIITTSHDLVWNVEINFNQ